MLSIFLQISIVLFIVLAVCVIMRILKQPLIIGYIISGIIIGPFALNVLEYNETISVFSEFGIAFLLFIVGLHLSPKVIKEVGKISLLAGMGQVIFTSLIGYLIALGFGFSSLISIYIAIAITFSSTIIVMKLLSDKDSLDKLYGKISIGFLLIQDVIAIIALIIVSTFSNGIDIPNLMVNTFIRGIVALIVIALVSYYILPRLNDFFAKSKELLFIFAITWGLGLAALFSYLGFSIEIGALIAGIALSISAYSYEIASKLKPLRDFFIVTFFVILGSQMVFGDINNMILPVIVFSLFILIGKPLIVMILIGIFGYTKNTGFMMGLAMAQISEFSLILITLGAKVGHIPNEIVSFITLVGLVTIAGSTYMIMYSEKMYLFFSKYLSIFERKKIKEKRMQNKGYYNVLLGENRIGFSIMNYFIKMNNYVIVDFNPRRVGKLQKRGINCIYGDVSDSEFLDSIKIEKAKIIVCTVPDIETNMLVLNKIRYKNKKSIVVVTAKQISDAFNLYDAGASYVIMPHFLGGEYTAKLIEKAKYDEKDYKTEKQRQIKDLKERLKEGQEHPNTERDKV
jgi:Kef-type K+ transport system membrane component KefB/Trk K+ transport system NAD-binding subunit